MLLNMVMFKVTICDIGKMNINMTDKIEKRRQPLQYRTMAMTTTIMSMVRASAAMTAAWKLRRHELCRELQRITSKRATHTRRCSSTTIQTIWVAVVTSPTLTARWCSILSMCLSVKSLLRNATTFGITPYLFNAKEFDEETGMYYYGARYYEPRLSLWMSVDPLQEKYPNISTYCYAANNPIKFIDSDGRKLLFASGTTEAFKQKFRAAIMYLHEHNADGIIAQIDKSSTIIYITERVGEASAFSKTKKTIYWDPNMGVLTSSDKKMSPAAVLNHEADHTIQYLKNPDKFAQDSKTLDPDYNDKEEMRVITGSEQKTALALGEISAGEVTRTDHIGIPYITKSPTTTEAKDGKIPKNPFVMDEIVISVPKSKNVNPNNDNNETDNK